jgi:hypothetical protein
MSNAVPDAWSAMPLDLRTWSPLRIAVALWIVLAVAMSVKCVVEPTVHSTYPVYEASGQWWLTGHDLYSADIAAVGFRYGPVFALAMTPLALLPTWLGGLLWSWLDLGLFLWTITLLFRRLLPGRWTATREAAFLVLVLLGSCRTMWGVQTNLLVFSLVGLAAMAIQDQRWWRAAFLLAIPVHIKVWPLAAVGLMTACWPRALAGRVVVALAAVAAVPFLAAPPAWVARQYVGWHALLVGPAQVRHDYRDAWTLWETMHSPVVPQLYMAMQLALGIAVLLLCWREARRATVTDRLLTLVLVLWTSWQLFCGPGTERNTFALIAPLTAWGLIVAFEERSGRWIMGLAFSCTTLASFGAIERAISQHFEGIIALHPVGVLLFVAWFFTWWRSTPPCLTADCC